MSILSEVNNFIIIGISITALIFIPFIIFIYYKQQKVKSV